MNKHIRASIFSCLVITLASLGVATPTAAAQRHAAAATGEPGAPITIDLGGSWHAFPHFWEQMFGSGRAILSLRESYRNDLRATRQITDFRYVRFHAIFHDEVGLYSEDAKGQPHYNYTYVDQIYDGLLAQGVRPFVELSFMPRQLASTRVQQPFWYHPNSSPPKDYARWDALISDFARHLVARYGIDEVSQWYFEVWNEPNLDFWSGTPAQATYWTLYDHTARDLKAVDARLRVGGPATAQAAWVDAFIAHATAERVPVDFVSTHVYGNDTARDVFGTNETIPLNRMVCRAVKKVHDQIKASAQPQLPLLWSEFNAVYDSQTAVTDAAFMGPWLADTIRQCDGLVDSMSYWTFSDVFEEQGVIKTPFFGGFGLLSVGGVPKPAFNAFKLLHALGSERLAVDDESVLVTRRADGTVVLAAWNYAPPHGPAAARTLRLRFQDLAAKTATITEIDAKRGDFHDAYAAMGSPDFPTTAQLAKLRKAADVPPSESVALKENTLELSLPPYGLALVELR
ncbi:MAG TPA: hypothetical protein VMI92_01370 [Steroidobacteraceae bacterium]|nr:hypothetical protein [Steroidobacteraceae bacterium]